MVLDKSAVKICLETGSGEKVAIDDIAGSHGSRVSVATSKKLRNLSQTGGDLNLQDLVDVLDLQLKQKQQLKFQRYLIIAGVMLLLCSFGLSLGSSVLSFMLMQQLEVHDGALSDKEGHVLGSQPRNPSVNNVTLVEESARRLSDDNVSTFHVSLPFQDFKQAVANYQSGTMDFVIPVDDDVFTVRIEEANGNPTTGFSARGTVASGVEWRGACAADASDCSVTVKGVRGDLHARAARRLYWWEDDDEEVFLHDAQAVFNPYCHCFNPTEAIKIINDIANSCTMHFLKCDHCFDYHCYDAYGSEAEDRMDTAYMRKRDWEAVQAATKPKCEISCDL